MCLRKIVLLITLLFLLSGVCAADVNLPSIFSDNMVLQQKSNVPIWGWGEASSKIHVIGSWAPNDTVCATVGGDGNWKVTIRTAEAGGPYFLEILQNGVSKKIFNHVMLGEVWLCSGQSNMQLNHYNNIDNKESEIARANHPSIRMMYIENRAARVPQDLCITSGWEVCTPQSMPRMSAVGYYFAKTLTETLDVPVGIICSAWGGTNIETWMPDSLVDKNSYYRVNAEKLFKEYIWNPSYPGATYNQMIHPLAPYALSGVLWYQGENNTSIPASYGKNMEKMISSWRDIFNKNLPFYFVQIAPFTYAEYCRPELLREEQEWVSKNVVNTGMVVVSDLVANVNDIHPSNKQDVGKRLARMALSDTYQKNTAITKSPTLKSVVFKNGKAIVTFHNSGKKLMSKGKDITGLKIAGNDGVFYDAKGEIKADKLIVFSKNVKVPEKVRYCFDKATIGNLFSQDSSLPVAPFRSDKGF